MIRLELDLNDSEAWALAQAIKRINVRSLGRDGLNISTPDEEGDAERAFIVFAQRLGEKGYLPR